MDTRVKGRMTKGLIRLAKSHVDPADLVDGSDLEIRSANGTWVVPDCENCSDRCCVHKERGSGILLSLRDVANLVDSGFGDLIVGRFTFRKKKGRYTGEIDAMPRLAKKQGDCIFYAPESGKCTQYGYRPTICRRFPYEVEYTKKTKEPFARFIPWTPCPKIEGTGDGFERAVRQMVVDAADDENVSFEDAMLLPDCLDELRELGFDRFLPPPEECPKA